MKIKKKKVKIIEFNSSTPEYSWLSNFYLIDGWEWKTAEHFYQALKARNTGDVNWIKEAPTPQEAKKRGSTIQLSKNWDKHKIVCMRVVLEDKFSQSFYLRKKLRLTYPHRLVHLASWDDFWGTGKNGKGKNMLGILLMALRAKYIRGFIEAENAFKKEKTS